MDALAIFNSVEAAWWILLGMIIWAKSRQPSFNQRLGRFTAAWFIGFGISDIIEVFTGAWWRPLPLLIFKGACLTALVTCGIIYLRTTRRRMISK